MVNRQSFKRPTILPNPTFTWAPAYERLQQFSTAPTEVVPA